jgi:hypothetical protein
MRCRCPKPARGVRTGRSLPVSTEPGICILAGGPTKAKVKRPLGVPTVSDRALQRSTAEVFFGSLDHEWVLRFVEQRVGDPRVINLIRRWLKAGLLEDGAVPTQAISILMCARGGRRRRPVFLFAVF